MRKLLSQNGMSLVSTAMFVMAVGVMMAAFFVVQEQIKTKEMVEETRKRTSAAVRMLDKFVLENGRLPCPASIGIPPDAVGFGGEVVAAGACDTSVLSFAANGVTSAQGAEGNLVQIGALPVRALNLPDEYIVDGYGHRYVYAVTANYTDAGNNPDFAEGQGDIAVNDVNGNLIGSAGGNMIYVVMSQGADDQGAYDFTGSLQQPCSGMPNCGWQAGGNPPAVFVQSLEKAFSLVPSDNLTQTFAFKASALKYEWHSDAWGACSPNCSSGTQTRNVWCEPVTGDGVRGTADDAGNVNCNPADEPVSSRSCSGIGSCSWWTSDDGWTQSCSGYCDSGSQSRSVECRDLDGDTVPDGECAGAGPKPAASNTCVLPGCDWEVGSYGSCSASCGGGTQYRSVWCQQQGAPNTTVPNAQTPISDCTTGSKPSNSRSCNNHSCCTPNCPSPMDVCQGNTYSSNDGCGGTCFVVGQKECKASCRAGDGRITAHGDTSHDGPAKCGGAHSTAMCGQYVNADRFRCNDGAYERISGTVRYYCGSCPAGGAGPQCPAYLSGSRSCVSGSKSGGSATTSVRREGSQTITTYLYEFSCSANGQTEHCSVKTGESRR